MQPYHLVLEVFFQQILSFLNKILKKKNLNEN
jgi:hypothetical protein